MDDQGAQNIKKGIAGSKIPGFYVGENEEEEYKQQRSYFYFRKNSIKMVQIFNIWALRVKSFNILKASICEIKFLSPIAMWMHVLISLILQVSPLCDVTAASLEPPGLIRSVGEDVKSEPSFIAGKDVK